MFYHSMQFEKCYNFERLLVEFHSLSALLLYLVLTESLVNVLQLVVMDTNVAHFSTTHKPLQSSPLLQNKT